MELMRKIKLGVFVLVLMFAFSGVSVYAAEIGNLTDENLVAYWNMDEKDGNTINDSKGNYNGIATGTNIIEDAVGNARYFDGSSYIDFSDSITPKGEKTIKFRIKKDSIPTNDLEVICTNIVDSSQNGIYIYIYKSGKVGFSSYKGVQDTNRFNVISSVNVCDGEWHDIILTWDGSTNADGVKVFIDDLLNPNVVGTANSLDTDGASYNLRIGEELPGSTMAGTRLFNGILDEIRIYNKYYEPLLSTPENLIATAGNAKVNLSWDAIAGATSYNILRSTKEGGKYDTIKQGVKETNYTDTDVQNGTTYYYVVCAVNDGVESAKSNEASATPKDVSGNKALLIITMSNGLEKEYDLSMEEIDDFIDWYDDRAKGSGDAYYTIDKDYNIGPFTSRKDYLVFDKIMCFEVMEYTNK